MSWPGPPPPIDWAAMERHGLRALRARREECAVLVVAELHGRSLCQCDPTEESYACPDEQHEAMVQAVVDALTREDCTRDPRGDVEPSSPASTTGDGR
jgi:hypothetical protein